MDKNINSFASCFIHVGLLCLWRAPLKLSNMWIILSVNSRIGCFAANSAAFYRLADRLEYVRSVSRFAVSKLEATIRIELASSRFMASFCEAVAAVRNGEQFNAIRVREKGQGTESSRS